MKGSAMEKLPNRNVSGRVEREDGVDRRGFLQCMAWVGTGVLWAVSGGVLSSCTVGPGGKREGVLPTDAEFLFAQLSDSHIGFSRPPNTDVSGTLALAIDRIAAAKPDLILHTGDLTHLAKPAEFDTVAQILATAKRPTFYVPGEHDFVGDDPAAYLERYGKGKRGKGWHSFDHKGTHFVGLVNISKGDSGLGLLGEEQLAWLRGDLAGVTSSTPVVIFAHVPLWTVYENWGWGTEDAARALQMLRRFGSVTVLNGHIHQVLQKVEGNITFHSACSTAFPQPAPGSAASPGPMKNVAAEKLKSMLGLTEVRVKRRLGTLAVIDETLE
jgi:3',5'-cyclic AMP phosphodiesterase CpdA